MLEGAGNAKAGNPMRRQTQNIPAAETDGALPAIDAADAVQHAGLAGAVRADQGKQFARLHRERYVVEHGQAAEPQRQRCDLDLSHTTSGCADTA